MKRLIKKQKKYRFRLANSLGPPEFRKITPIGIGYNKKGGKYVFCEKDTSFSSGGFDPSEWKVIYPNDPDINTLISKASYNKEEDVWLLYPKIYSEKGDGGKRERRYSFDKIYYFLFKRKFLGLDSLKEEQIVKDVYVDNDQEKKDATNKDEVVTEEENNLPYSSQLEILNDVIDERDEEDSNQQNNFDSTIIKDERQ